MMRRITGALLAVGLLAWGAGAAMGQSGYGSEYGSPAAAGDKAERQLATAIDHARNSANSGTMATAVTHLGHTLNCIEGTRGKNFNAAWGQVCQGQGDGILTDIKRAKNADSVMLVLTAANDLAVAGVKARDLAAVQNAARGVGALLQVVMNATR